MNDRMRSISIGAITALVAAVLGLLVEFGVGLSHTQKESILVVIAALGPILAGLVGGMTDRVHHYDYEDRHDRTPPRSPGGPVTGPGGPAGSGPARPQR